MKRHILFFITLFAITIPLFLWSVLTEKTTVRLAAEGDTLTLYLNNREVALCHIPPYRTARLGILLRQYRQAGESFFQGWDNIELIDGETSRVIFKDNFDDSPTGRIKPRKGKWTVDLWGHYCLKGSPFNYLGFGEAEIDKTVPGNFIFEGCVYNLSAAGLSITTDRGDRITAYIDIYPGPVVNWLKNGEIIETTYAVDISHPSAEKIDLWPSKTRIIKSILAKVLGTVLAACFLLFLTTFFSLVYNSYFKLAAWLFREKP